MSDLRIVEGKEIHKGTLTCPSPDLCDRRKWERHESYVERHCADHGLNLGYSENAERNLGLWCGYFDHKYIWGNPTLTPYPHWELHAFLTTSQWSRRALESDIPIAERTFMIPPIDERGEVEYRRFKQVEVPRQSQKTAAGARWYPVFRAKHEYFVNDRSNYRIIIRSNTKKNVGDTLRVIRRMAASGQRIKELYGVWIARCERCLRTSVDHEKFAFCQQEGCGKRLKRGPRRAGLVNESKGAGAYGTDIVSFRWLTDAKNADAVAAYSIWVAGLGTSTTGQRPDLYIWDDPQTEENSDTVDKRADIAEKFDESVRQLEIPGELLVLDTRKYIDDFAGNIQKPPLNQLFWSLHRRARWRTTEPDNPPYVVNGYRYYYPIKGNGGSALNASELDRLESQMRERRFSAEYMNDPADATKALFRREWFRIVDRSEAPPEVKYGLGREVRPHEQQELDALNVKIIAYNACDPSAKSVSSKRGDDTFIVALRVVPRFQAVYVTRLVAGQWASSRRWAEIEKANAYNRPQFTDYECPNDEDATKDSFEKWCRERAEELSRGSKEPVSLIVPMRWSSMPKTRKTGRMEEMEPLMRNGGFFILSDAADPDTIEKYISQWLGLGVMSHDDGPDATSRLHHHIVQHYHKARKKPDEEPVIKTEDGVTAVPLSLIEEMSIKPDRGGLWGERGW